MREFLKTDLWILDMDSLSKAKARWIKYLKIMLITIQTFANERIGFQAVALSFYSTMSVVPFLAIIFGITGGLGLADRLKDYLYGYFENSQQIIDVILGFAQNIIDTAQSGLMGFFSALIFFYAVIALMLNVERVFNNVWMVEKARNIFKRLSFIIAMIIISPFVVMVFFAGSFLYSRVLEFAGIDIESLGIFKTILVWTIFAALATFTFSAMYKYIPNVKVHFSAAFNAAIIAAAAFVIMQYLYMETQILVSRINAVYGAFAAVPLFLIWMNVSWVIILIGAEVSHAFQYVDGNPDRYIKNSNNNSRIGK